MIIMILNFKQPWARLGTSVLLTRSIRLPFSSIRLVYLSRSALSYESQVIPRQQCSVLIAEPLPRGAR